MLNELQNRFVDWRLDVAIALLLTLGAFAVRIHNVGFNSLSEDETAKWLAIEEYRQGHFVGVNSEHPMLLKVFAWGSLSIGERWNRVASLHSWPSINPEGWLRLPNVLLGAATAAILYLLCRRMMGIAGSFAASFIWAFAPLPIALNRLTKEETALTFFTLLGCYFYCRAQQVHADVSVRRWYDLSAIGFGLRSILFTCLASMRWPGFLPEEPDSIASRRGSDTNDSSSCCYSPSSSLTRSFSFRTTSTLSRSGFTMMG